MSIKKYSSGSWVTVPYRKYETATDTITSLPKTIIGDGQPISSWSMDGNMQVNGTPTPQNPITPAETGDKTANLFNGTLTTMYPDGSNRVMENADMKSFVLPIKANETITYSNIYSTSFQRAVITDEYPEKELPFLYADRHDFVGNTASFTNDKNYDRWLLICPYRASVTTYTIEEFFENVMVNKGSTALPYEPYGQYKIPILSNGNTYPIYLSEPIRKIDTYSDSVASSGTVTRNIKKMVLTGEETWGLYDGYIRFFYCNANPTMLTSIDNYPCTHFDHVEWGYMGASIRIFDSDSLYADTTEFATFLQQQYAAGTPVTVWYVLATPTTEQVTVPTLTTTGTAEQFDVDTTLKPSEVSLTYHGWHEHSDTKYSNP